VAPPVTNDLPANRSGRNGDSGASAMRRSCGPPARKARSGASEPASDGSPPRWRYSPGGPGLVGTRGAGRSTTSTWPAALARRSGTAADRAVAHSTTGSSSLNGWARAASSAPPTSSALGIGSDLSSEHASPRPHLDRGFPSLPCADRGGGRRRSCVRHTAQQFPRLVRNEWRNREG
jgi:hypothetical protein